MRRVLAMLGPLVVVVVTAVQLPSMGASAAASSTPGVTASTIKVGITYPDVAAIRSVINVDPGDYVSAYKALINQINHSGGINGRKIAPVFSAVNPLGTSGAATACTQLTEDDGVFVVLGFFQTADTACYLDTHATPIIGQSLTTQESSKAQAPWYNDQISQSELVPKEMAYFKEQGAFAGKKVAVVGTYADTQEMALVATALRNAKAHVVATATNSVPDTDTTAQVQEYGVIAEKFKSAGADVVVAVGNSGNGWPSALQQNQSTYTPRLIATDYNDLDAYVSNKAGVSQQILKNVLTAGPTPPAKVTWDDPTMKSCVATIQKAEPNASISNPVTATASTPVTYTAPETACPQVALLKAIITAAGKTLTTQTFARGAASLKGISLPGGGGTFNFSGGHNDGNGPVFVYTWSPSGNKLVLKTTLG